MPIRHVVTFVWDDHVDDAHVAAVTERLAALPDAIPEIRAYRFGPNAGISPGGADYAVTADFDDVDGYVTYRDHPTHRALIDELISGHVASRSAVQFRFD